MIMASSSTTSSNKSMIHGVEKPNIQEPLKCPRCDSSNTKFCYYNNYSLSQPRHFCKACKRYWTRGGTLRNVPVGGGCRKNKRVKRLPPSNNGGEVGVSAAMEKAAAGENPSFLLQAPHVVDLSHSSSFSTSSLLYNLPPTANNINSPLDFSFPFSNLSSSKVNSSDHHSAGLIFDLQPNQVNGLGIGFSTSSGLVDNSGGIHQNSNNEFMRNGLMKNFLQDHVMNSSSSTSPVLMNNNNPILFGSSTANFSTSSSSTTMASLLALKDFHTRSNFQGLMPYHHGDDNSIEPNIRGMKTEGINGSGWNPDPDPDPNSNAYNISQITSSDDPKSNPLWNTDNVSSWFDPSNNIGSSVSSLI